MKKILSHWIFQTNVREVKYIFFFFFLCYFITDCIPITSTSIPLTNQRTIFMQRWNSLLVCTLIALPDTMFASVFMTRICHTKSGYVRAVIYRNDINISAVFLVDRLSIPNLKYRYVNFDEAVGDIFRYIVDICHTIYRYHHTGMACTEWITS